MSFDLQKFFQSVEKAAINIPLRPTKVTSKSEVYGLRQISLQHCGYWADDVKGRSQNQAGKGCGKPFLFARNMAMMGEVPCWRYNGHLVSYDFARDGNYFEALDLIEFSLNRGLKIVDYGIDKFHHEFSEQVEIICPNCGERRLQYTMRGTEFNVEPLSKDMPWNYYFRSYSTAWLLDGPI